MLSKPKVLLLSSDEAETSLLKEILGDRVVLKSIKSLTELRSILESDNYDAMFCGWSFHQGTWHEALGQIKQRYPNLPVIVFSRAGGEKEWLEALEAGAFDLLVAPYMKRNVLPVLEHAVASYEARRLHHFAPYSRTKVS
ncbi:MAG: response regulator [Acidobacteria bacterium]|nr:response regulator [Acidobacteriota bacterium]